MAQSNTLKAVVKNGRIVLDEPTDLPEGEVIELVPADSYAHLDEPLDAREKAKLDARKARVEEERKRVAGERDAVAATIPEEALELYQRVAGLRGTGLAEGAGIARRSRPAPPSSGRRESSERTAWESPFPAAGSGTPPPGRRTDTPRPRPAGATSRR